MNRSWWRPCSAYLTYLQKQEIPYFQLSLGGGDENVSCRGRTCQDSSHDSGVEEEKAHGKLLPPSILCYSMLRSLARCQLQRVHDFCFRVSADTAVICSWLFVFMSVVWVRTSLHKLLSSQRRPFLSLFVILANAVSVSVILANAVSDSFSHPSSIILWTSYHLFIWP